MHDKDRLTTLTERGQTSVPASLRKAAKLKSGQKLLWEQISDTEFRVRIAAGEDAPGPLAMLGYAKKFRPADKRSTNEIMASLREGDQD